MKPFALLLLLLASCACEREPITPLPEPESYVITSNCAKPYEVKWFDPVTNEEVRLFTGTGAFDTVCIKPLFDSLWLVAITNPMQLQDSIWLSIGCVRVQSQGVIIIK
jgi:hypothetical protein